MSKKIGFAIGVMIGALLCTFATAFLLKICWNWAACQWNLPAMPYWIAICLIFLVKAILNCIKKACEKRKEGD